MIIPQRKMSPNTSLVMPGESVILVLSVIKMKAYRYSFQESVKAKMVAAATPGAAQPGQAVRRQRPDHHRQQRADGCNQCAVPHPAQEVVLPQQLRHGREG